jgi:putative hydrolase of the HAD superfamily
LKTIFHAIVFDAVGTLIHPDPPATAVYAQVAANFGCRLSPDIIASRFQTAFQHEEATDREAGYRTSEEREHERWRYIVSQALNGVASTDDCFEVLFDHFSHGHAWRYEPDLDTVTQDLRRRGFQLGLASNYDARLRQVVAELPVLATLHPLVISSEVGWRKPAPEFFQFVCRRLGLSPHQVLYVGDDLVNDYAAARKTGLQAVLFDPEVRAPILPFRINRLGDLVKYLI